MSKVETSYVRFCEVNFDSALDMRANTCGIGIVIIDEKGMIMGAKATNSHCFNALFLLKQKQHYMH